jgi:hypothetical protein
MPHGKDLMFGLGVDLAAFGKELDQAARMADQLKTSPVQLSAKGGAAEASPLGGSSSEIASQVEMSFGRAGAKISSTLRQAMQSTNVPIMAIGSHLDKMFDRLSGAAISAFRRIDAAIKFPTYDAWYGKTIAGLRGFKVFPEALADGGRKIGESLSPVPLLVAQMATKTKETAASFGLLDRLSKALRGNLAAMREAERKAATVDVLPKAGKRPGRGRAIPLAGPTAAPPTGLQSALALAKEGSLTVASIVADFARGSEIIARTSLKAFAQVGGGILSLSQRMMRFKWVWGSMSDVAGKTFRQLYESQSLFRRAIGGAIGVVGKLAHALIRVGSLGTIGKARSQVEAFSTSTRAARGAVNGLSNSVMGFGRQLIVALGFFGLAFKVVEFFKTGIKGAIDLGETVNATKVIFGKFSVLVTQKADELANRFGLVKDETLKVANGFGEFGVAAGLSGGAATLFSLKMTKLAADLSNFKRMKLEDAAQSIRGALGGSAKALRDQAVLMSEGSVKTQALAMGLASVGGKAKHMTVEVTDQAKILARAAVITEGLRLSTGSLARTQGDAASQFRKTGGGITNFGVSIGQVLLPAVKAGEQSFNELLATVVGVFEAAKPSLEAFVGKVVAVMDGVGAAIRNIDLVWKLAVISFRQGLLNIIAILATLPENLTIIGEFISKNWVGLICDAFNVVEVAANNMVTNFAGLGKAIFDWLSDPTKGFNFEWTPMLKGFNSTIDKFPSLVKPVFADLSKEAAEVWDVWDKREADRKKAMGGENPAAAAGAKTAEASKDVEHKLAGAVDINSKEAYEALAKNRAGGGKGNVVAKIATQQLQVQRDQLAEAKKANAAKAGPVAIVKGF